MVRFPSVSVGYLRKATRLFHGFTQLELMVALGTVVVLAVLLLPVFTKLRASGQQVRCTSNLRQIITAYLTKVSDLNGRFPSSRTAREYDPGTGGTRIPKGGFVYDMLADYIPSPASILTRPGAVATDAGVYWCPGRDPAKTSLTVPGAQAPIYSYAHNVELGGQNAQPTQSWLGPNGGGTANPTYNPALAIFALVPRPSRIIAFTEHAFPGNTSTGNLLSSSWPFPTGSSPEPPATGRQMDFTRHQGRSQAAFLDGSIRSLTFEDLKGTRAAYLVPVVE